MFLRGPAQCVEPPGDDVDDGSEDARSEKNEGHMGHIGLDAPLPPVSGANSGDTPDIQPVGLSPVRAAMPMHDAY